jgi:outer membrane lipoprotein SlyB
VIAVEQGGKVSQPAHLAIRFHTLILADGSQVALRTESIDRRSESPANSSTKKIGGAAVAGTILGAIIGGGKGAAAGAGIGAGAGTAAVMAGDRAAVTMPAGQLLNARLSSPATITVEKREQQ